MTIKTSGFVSIAAINAESASLLDAYKSAFESQAATNELEKVTGAQYRRLRAEAKAIQMEMLAKLNGDWEKMDHELVREMFNIRLKEQAEELFDGTEEAKAFGFDKQPPVWTNAKSQIGKGLERGFNFIEDEISQNQLRNWVSRYDKNVKDKDMADRIAKAREAGLLKDMGSKSKPSESNKSTEKAENPQPGGDAGDLPAGVEGQTEPVAVPGTTPPASIKTGASSLTEEQVKQIQDTISMMEKIASIKGPDAVAGMLKGWTNMVSQSYDAMNKAIEGLAKAG